MDKSASSNHDNRSTMQKLEELSGIDASINNLDVLKLFSFNGCVHFLHSEWNKMERERTEWQLERSELQQKIHFLQSERDGQENIKTELVRRIKMLENELRTENVAQRCDLSNDAACRAAAVPYHTASNTKATTAHLMRFLDEISGSEFAASDMRYVLNSKCMTAKEFQQFLERSDIENFLDLHKNQEVPENLQQTERNDREDVEAPSHSAAQPKWQRFLVSPGLRALRYHLDCVRCVAFHPEMCILIAASDDCTITAWDLSNLRTNPHAYFGNIGASNSARNLNSGDGDADDERRPICVLRAHSAPVLNLHWLAMPTNNATSSQSSAASNTDWLLASSDLTGQCYVWDLEALLHHHHLDGQNALVTLSHSPASCLALPACHEDNDAIWNLFGFREEGLAGLHLCGIFSSSLSSSGCSVWRIGFVDGDCTEQREEKTLENEVTDGAVLKRREIQVLRHWPRLRISSSSPIQLGGATEQFCAAIALHHQSVTQSSSNLMLIGCRSGALLLVSLDTHFTMTQSSQHHRDDDDDATPRLCLLSSVELRNRVTCLAAHPTHSRVALAGLADGSVHLLSITARHPAAKADTIAADSADRSQCVISMTSQARICCHDGAEVLHLGFDCSALYLMTAGADDWTRWWDLAAKEPRDGESDERRVVKEEKSEQEGEASGAQWACVQQERVSGTSAAHTHPLFSVVAVGCRDCSIRLFSR